MARFRVSSETDVVEVVRAARESRRTLEIVGHGTKRGFGRSMECDDVLDLSALSGIVKYEPDEMIITARAGTPVAEIETALAERNQRLGFEPADWGPLFDAPANAATIGGVLSANCDGSATVRYGRCRDHLLGFRAVNGFGEAYKGGGKVVKNVTGFDLPKLFCGAMGMLGPLTEVTLRVFPKPSRSIGLIARGMSAADGLAFLRRVWGSPVEATGLAYLSEAAAMAFPQQNPAYALIRIEGEADVLNVKKAAVRALAPEIEFDEIGDSDWLLHILNAGLVFMNSSAPVWRLHVPASTAARLVDAISPKIWWGDWAGGLLWLVSDRDVRTAARQFDVRAICMRGDGAIPPFAPEDRVRSELTQRVKAAFDPLRLFNPRRMWEGV
jgi:glycolate oxidase FAD binding subunit